MERYCGWNGFRFHAGALSWFVSSFIGGRILSLTLHGRELLFVQKEHEGETFDVASIADPIEEKRKLGFRLWGGDKTWIAPQREWKHNIPPLEPDAGSYEYTIEENTITMRSALCRETGVVVERTITPLYPDGILLEQKLTNRSNETVEKAIWDVTQFLRPFDVYLPQPQEKIITFAHEGDSVELRDRMVASDGKFAVIRCLESAGFKYGMPPSPAEKMERIIAVQRTGTKTLLHVRDFLTDGESTYADGACIEVYNSPFYDYLELEVHSPMRRLRPGQSVSHAQRWYFWEIEGTPSIEEMATIVEERLSE